MRIQQGRERPPRRRRWARAWRCRRHGLADRVDGFDGVAAARQVELHRVRGAFARVVLGEPLAQPQGLDAHERIRLRVEIRRPAEDLDRDRVALEPLAFARQSLADHEAQEVRRSARVLETTATENALERRAYLGCGRLCTGGGWGVYGLLRHSLSVASAAPSASALSFL